MAKKRRTGLGKGLGALIPPAGRASGLRTVSIDAIQPNPRQPRTQVDEASLKELAASIREVGLIQPLIVQELPPEGDPAQPPRYQLITGERRWRAARLAGLRQVEVVIKEASDRELLELALVENIQRADLNPLEEAAAYWQLSQEFGLTQEQIAERVGKSRVSITNTMRLLRLPEPIKEALLQQEITEGHARALLMLPDSASQLAVLKQIREKGLSVRQTEELVRRNRTKRRARSPKTRTPETEALERAFRESLGTKVNLFRTRKGGKLVIHFYSEEELQAIYERIVGET